MIKAHNTNAKNQNHVAQMLYYNTCKPTFKLAKKIHLNSSYFTIISIIT